jgi:cell division protein FtsW
VTAAGLRHPGEKRWETNALATVTLVLVAIGVAACYAAGSYLDTWYREAQQQLTGAVVGGVLFLLVSRIDYRRLRVVARPLMYATLAGLALIAVVALVWRGRDAPGMIGELVPHRNGSKRWLALPGMQVQVSEIARFALPLMLATLLVEMGPKTVRKFSEGFVPLIRPVALVVALVAVQTNLSMAILLGTIGMAVAFIGGTRIGHLLLVAALGAAAAGAFLVINPERGSRVDEYLVPSLECDIDSQVCNSLIGLGNGGLVGVGYGQGTQKLGRMSLGYSDFILSIIGEEVGFVGVVVLALLFVAFCWIGFRIAATAPDLFGTALAGGLTTMVAASALLHAAVVLKLGPTTGVTLPFISAGRVSLVIYLLSAGVLVAIGRKRGKPVTR